MLVASISVSAIFKSFAWWFAFACSTILTLVPIGTSFKLSIAPPSSFVQVIFPFSGCVIVIFCFVLTFLTVHSPETSMFLVIVTLFEMFPFWSNVLYSVPSITNFEGMCVVGSVALRVKVRIVSSSTES